MDREIIMDVVMASLHRQTEPGVNKAFKDFSQILTRIAPDDDISKALKELQKDSDSDEAAEELFTALKKANLSDNKLLNTATKKMMSTLENRDLQYSGTGTVQKRTYISYEEEDDDDW